MTGYASKKEAAPQQFHRSVQWTVLGSKVDKEVVWFWRPVSQTLRHLIYSSGEAYRIKFTFHY
jgi:hypothetical protein